jgi:DNA-binding PadR family transcriptional regulator
VVANGYDTQNDIQKTYPSCKNPLKYSENDTVFTFEISFRETPSATINRKAEERTVARNLDLIILCLAKKQSINGYDITLFIRRYFNVWLSAGTVYSTLHALERKGLLEPVKERKAKCFTISKKGKDALEVMYFVLSKIKHIMDVSKGGFTTND